MSVSQFAKSPVGLLGILLSIAVGGCGERGKSQGPRESIAEFNEANKEGSRAKALNLLSKESREQVTEILKINEEREELFKELNDAAAKRFGANFAKITPPVAYGLPPDKTLVIQVLEEVYADQFGAAYKVKITRKHANDEEVMTKNIQLAKEDGSWKLKLPVVFPKQAAWGHDIGGGRMVVDKVYDQGQQHFNNIVLAWSSAGKRELEQEIADIRNGRSVNVARLDQAGVSYPGWLIGLDEAPPSVKDGK